MVLAEGSSNASIWHSKKMGLGDWGRSLFPICLQLYMRRCGMGAHA